MPNTGYIKDLYTWSEVLSSPIIHPFVAPSLLGPTISIPDSPLGIFRQYFSPSIIQEIVKQTNHNAENVMEPEKYSRWCGVTAEEIEAFIGFSFLMGLNPKPSVEDYWGENPIYTYPPINKRISRDRYKDINRYLHFVDNSTLAPGYDKFEKIRPLLELLQSQYKDLYNPRRDLSVDEAMIKFQGRSSLVHAHETNQTRDQSVGPCRQFQWILLSPGHIHWEEG